MAANNGNAHTRAARALDRILNKPRTALLLDRRSQRALDRPPALEAAMQGIHRHVYSFCPLRDGQSLTLELKKTIASRIIRLLYDSSPSAICRPSPLAALLTVTAGVMPVYINSIYAVLHAWSFADVIDKIFQAGFPMIADHNTPAAIMGKPLVVGVRASSQHVHPGCVTWGICQSMSSVSVRKLFSLQASAATGVCIAESCTSDYVVRPTVAKTKPHTLLVPVLAYIANRQKTAKSLTRHVFDTSVCDWHNWRQIIADNCKKGQLRGIITHSNGLLTAVAHATGCFQHRRGNSFIFPFIIAHLVEERKVLYAS